MMLLDDIICGYILQVIHLPSVVHDMLLVGRVVSTSQFSMRVGTFT